MKRFSHNILTLNFYRVSSTSEGTVFTGVCLLTFRGGGTPSGWWGVPPSQVWMGRGTPFPGLDGDTPFPVSGQEVPPAGGTPGRVHPPGRGYLPPLPGGTPPTRGYPHQTSTACTCYAVGGMPLAFTQEDFLVRHCFALKPLSFSWFHSIFDKIISFWTRRDILHVYNFRIKHRR